MEPKEIKEALEKEAVAVEALRKSIEDNDKISHDKLEELRKDVLDGEKASKIVQETLEKQEKILNDQEELIKTMEKQFHRMPAGSKDSEKREEIKAFERYIINKPKEELLFALNDLEKKYLRTDLAQLGGVLVPEILFNELIKQEIEISPVMENSRVINSTIKAMDVAIRTTVPTVNRPGEGGTSSVSNSNYKSVRLEAYRNDVITPITREELNFTSFDMVQQMTEDAAIALAEQTNVDFLSGDGVSKSTGILTDPDVKVLNSGFANEIAMDNFYEIQKKDNIKTKYRRNGRFYMNSNTLFDLLQRKDGNGQYLWTQNIALGLPNTLAGSPYVETPDMPDIGTDTFPVFFGDLRQAYYILRAIGIELLIDPFTAKKDGIIEYQWIEFIGGKIVLAEAIVKLKAAV